MEWRNHSSLFASGASIVCLSERGWGCGPCVDNDVGEICVNRRVVVEDNSAMLLPLTFPVESIVLVSIGEISANGDFAANGECELANSVFPGALLGFWRIDKDRTFADHFELQVSKSVSGRGSLLFH